MTPLVCKVLTLPLRAARGGMIPRATAPRRSTGRQGIATILLLISITGAYPPQRHLKRVSRPERNRQTEAGAKNPCPFLASTERVAGTRSSPLTKATGRTHPVVTQTIA